MDETPHKKWSWHGPLLGGVLALLLIMLVLNGFFISYLIRKADQFDAQDLASLIVRSAENLVHAAPVDGKTGDVYLPEAKLKLPPPVLGTGFVLYNYLADNAGNPGLYVASHQALLAAEGPIYNATNTVDGFSGVPHLQACARGVYITWSPQKGVDIDATKKLANGKTVYFYAKGDCFNQTFFNYVQQIDSY